MRISFKDEKFSELLMRNGDSLRSFARQAGISSPYMSQLIKGNRNPSPKMAKKICESLEVKFDDIFFIDSGYKSNQTKSA